ncbi:MBL fold metallo-hydrolase [Magnetofaba australis]|uniref:Putative beta-lactamase domain-containing protein n=1 Tax=Magnetofaba australis IT-1 TaxID=1434232 RepID=A0A1Y2K361_9PROT|nr:ribonuclease Z [Magnetofaba australis]OSM02488.1 putative beta-lactamase domain-containing protein [Magnetofaba australis IT-1]
MRGYVLGSGAGAPTPERALSGYWLELDDGSRILLDCGSGTLTRMAGLGLPIADLDIILITHLHPDHVGELITLFHALRMPTVQRDKPLRVYGPQGIEEFFAQVVWGVAKPPGRFAVSVQTAPEVWEVGRATLISAPTRHSASLPSLGYRVQVGQRALVYSGDADWSEGLLALCAQADLAILDCSSLTSEKIPGHLSAQECGRLAAQAQVKALLLSHFYAQPMDDDASARACQSEFDGVVWQAEDGLAFEIGAERAICARGGK